jgi:maltooligosyltrehalose trehalohydrolase
MPVAEFPGARGWGYDGVYISAAAVLLRRPEGLARLVAPPTSGLAVILDVVYNHSAPPGVQAIEAFGPYFTGSTRRRGGGRSTTTTPTATRCASGSARAPSRLDPRLRHRRAAPRRDPRDLRLERRAHRRRGRAARPRGQAGALVIAESGLNDPRVMRPRVARRVRLRRQWADDFHHALRTLLTGRARRLLRGVRARRQLAKAFHRPHVHDGGYSPFRRRRFGAPADDVPPSDSSSSPRTTTRSATAPSATGCRRGAAAGRVLHAAVAVRAAAVHGRGVRRDAPFQFFSDHIDEEIAEATREGRRREFAAFAQFGQEIPDPAGIETFERSKLTRRRPALAALYRELIAVRRELPPATPTRSLRRGRALAARAAREFELVCNFGSAEPVRCRARPLTGPARTHGDAAPASGVIELPPLAGSC